MNLQSVLAITSICFGFVSSLFFAWGSAFSSANRLLALSKTSWGYNPDSFEALVCQSTQYLIGACFLLLAFSLQLTPFLYSYNPVLNECIIFKSPLHFLIGLLLILLPPSYLLYKILVMRKIKKLEPKLLGQIQ